MTKMGGGTTATATGGGSIYGIPCNSARVLRIDPSSDGDVRTSLVGGDLSNGRMKWISGALSPYDGCIYCMPYDARRILRFDPATQETTLVGDDLGDGYKYSATVLVQGGSGSGSGSCSGGGVVVDIHMDVWLGYPLTPGGW